MKFLVVLIFLLQLPMAALTQDTLVIPEATVTSILRNSAESFESTIYNADSLYKLYIRTPFQTEDTMGIMRDGMITVRDFYVLASRLKPGDEYAQSMITKIEANYPYTDRNAFVKQQLQKADDYFANGEYDKAIALYEQYRSFYYIRDTATIDAQIKEARKLQKKQEKK